MKVSQNWLQEWLPSLPAAKEWVSQMVMAGFEAVSIQLAAPEFNLVVIGKVITCQKHPNADRLSLCEVDVGQEKTLSIICGAENMRQNLYVAVALPGAVLPNGMQIKSAKLRGVVSEGMICSAKELGVSNEDSLGVLELESNAPVGQSFRQYWQLDDHIVDFEITPNRGDCLSIQGMAREIAAVQQKKITPIKIVKVTPDIKEVRNIIIDAKPDCPRYAGRIMRDINVSAITPIHIRERLRCCGIRSINIVVDILNYVMLELGQPMHAFDLSRLDGDICVRYARLNEKIILLDNTELSLGEQTLVIADQSGVCALAGIMGGRYSSVRSETRDIFIESAFFTPSAICKSVQAYGLHTNSSYRFERGVDPQLQCQAIERATELLYRFAGGKVGVLIDCQQAGYLPTGKTILLRYDKIRGVLGTHIQANKILNILMLLNMQVSQEKNHSWRVKAPSYRFDIDQEMDIIEEVIRLYGYDQIDEKICTAAVTALDPESETYLTTSQLADVMIGRGYHEVVTYSFIDETLHSLLGSDEQAIRLSNPLSADMAWMRTSLWPGLIKTAIYNQNRQAAHIRLFETGLCFSLNLEGDIVQSEKIGGLITGSLYPLQWGVSDRAVDFFDIKADVQAMFQLMRCRQPVVFKSVTAHSVLYPSQAAALYKEDECIGYVGALHPALVKKLKLLPPVYIFECLLHPLKQADLPYARLISKFPSVRRDIALIVDRSIMAADLEAYIRQQAKWLKDITVFDIYIGENLKNTQKSIALRLTFSDISRTLKEREINDQVSTLVIALQKQYKAILRGSS
jgi:phenylalanyl-tRNA synthetase beta chain